MSTVKRIVVIHCDTGYGEMLLDHINAAIGGKDMRAVAEITDSVEFTADGEPVCTTDNLYCPKCGGEVRCEHMLAYCDECPNPDDGGWPNQPPLPLNYESCLAKPKVESRAKELEQ